MGYSISVNCKSKKTQKQMLEFLEENFRHWAVVLGGKDDVRYITDPMDDLSYAHGKTQIGFDYGAGFSFDNTERGYYYGLLRWIALKIGRKRKVIRSPGNETWRFDEPVPYITYDGYDHWPVLLDKPDKPLRWCWVDKYGIKRCKDTLAEEYGALVHELLTKPAPKEKGKPRGIIIDPRVMEMYEGGKGPAVQEFMGVMMPHFTIEARIIIVKKLLWDEVKKRVKPARDELKRLDKLWSEHVQV